MKYKEGDKIYILDFGPADWYASNDRIESFKGKPCVITEYKRKSIYSANGHDLYVSFPQPINGHNIKNQTSFYFIDAYIQKAIININPKIRVL